MQRIVPTLQIWVSEKSKPFYHFITTLCAIVVGCASTFCCKVVVSVWCILRIKPFRTIWGIVYNN